MSKNANKATNNNDKNISENKVTNKLKPQPQIE